MRVRRILLAVALLAAAVITPALAGAPFHGSTGSMRLNRPIVGMAPTPSGGGYWLVASDGGVFSFGDARFLGSTGSLRLRSPVVGMAATPTGRGYWLVAGDGGLFAFGDAPFVGSAAGAGGSAVGMARTPSGRGYWIAMADGRVLNFGDAPALGRAGSPVVGIAATGSGRGYWLAGPSGTVSTFGDAGRHGSVRAPVIGITATPGGRGYWMVGADGGVFALGDARFFGSMGGRHLNRPVVGMAGTPDGTGYWLVASDGGIFAFPAALPPLAASPTLGGCPMFPADNPWNADVSRLPVHPRSAQWIADIDGGGNRFLHADFGENQSYGIPFVVVPQSQPTVPIRFTDYGDESDPGPYPVPRNAPVEAGSDRHVLVLQQGACRLYELFGAVPTSSGWDAASGAVFDLRSNRLRPEGWTSADAAGLPILPGLVRHDEVAAGAIRHALRFTVRRTQRGYIHPATHFAGTTPTAPPMGARLRLKAAYDISGYTGQARVVLEALRRYGMIVADNGTSWYISGATHPGWDDDDLNQLKRVPGTAFEVVDTGPVRP